MNELHRQMYLAALGVDTYMPRWLLPFAPQSVPCEFPQNIHQIIHDADVSRSTDIVTTSFVKPSVNEVSAVSHLINDITKANETIKTSVKPLGATDILAHLDTKPKTIESFSLSIWRPENGVMLIDSRNTKLALPTELLMNNLLRAEFKNQPVQSMAEVLRWPMIENSFTKRTENDARIDLQTWLSVQHEIRPIRYLWLMGENAASYFLPTDISFQKVLFKSQILINSSISALVLPSLNELLQHPSWKQSLFLAIRQYHSTSL